MKRLPELAQDLNTEHFFNDDYAGNRCWDMKHKRPRAYAWDRTEPLKR